MLAFGNRFGNAGCPLELSAIATVLDLADTRRRAEPCWKAEQSVHEANDETERAGQDEADEGRHDGKAERDEKPRPTSLDLLVDLGPAEGGGYVDVRGAADLDGFRRRGTAAARSGTKVQRRNRLRLRAGSLNVYSLTLPTCLKLSRWYVQQLRPASRACLVAVPDMARAVEMGPKQSETNTASLRRCRLRPRRQRSLAATREEMRGGRAG